MNSNFSKYFCAICWRPLDLGNQRTKFCAFHQQPLGSAEYKKRMRLLSNVGKKMCKEAPAIEIFNTLLSKVQAPDSVNRMITKSSENRGESITVSEISKICGDHYVNCFNELKNVNASRFVSVTDWGIAIINALNRGKSHETILEIIATWKKMTSQVTPAEQRRLVIHLISRIEVEKQELANPLSRGPRAGSVDVNHDILRSLLTAYDELCADNISVNLAIIAREHGVTRQTMRAKWKMLLKDPEVYRKVLKKG